MASSQEKLIIRIPAPRRQKGDLPTISSPTDAHLPKSPLGSFVSSSTQGQVHALRNISINPSAKRPASADIASPSQGNVQNEGDIGFRSDKVRVVESSDSQNALQKTQALLERYTTQVKEADSETEAAVKRQQVAQEDRVRLSRRFEETSEQLAKILGHNSRLEQKLSDLSREHESKQNAPPQTPAGDLKAGEIQAVLAGERIKMEAEFQKQFDDAMDTLRKEREQVETHIESLQSAITDMETKNRVESAEISARVQSQVQSHMERHVKITQQEVQMILKEKTLENAIRELMQDLLEIKYDRSIGEAVQRGHFTNLEQASAFANFNVGIPALTPFRPCWENLEGPWNKALGDLFVERLKLDHPEFRANGAYIRKYFRQRLRTLREALNIHYRDSNGDIREARASNGRRTERRRMIYTKRLDWTVDNSHGLQADGSYPMLFLYQMVKLLGTDGMSSDESTGNPDTMCTVVHKNWRHPDVVRLLRWIDLNLSNRSERKVSGPEGHLRLRLPHGKAAVTLRYPIAGLPVNFYHPEWYDGLEIQEKKRLGALKPQPLPLHLLPSIQPD
ncbi:hypothetical protein B0H11DRAFT_2232244 [Mycena galericulata]|nr:hypothetical protein B0H11DRAFT_2232244 [Mycena galericulata]